MPSAQYLSSIREDTPVGTPVLTVSAVDKDSPPFNSIGLLVLTFFRDGFIFCVALIYSIHYCVFPRSSFIVTQICLCAFSRKSFVIITNNTITALREALIFSTIKHYFWIHLSRGFQLILYWMTKNERGAKRIISKYHENLALFGLQNGWIVRRSANTT